MLNKKIKVLILDDNPDFLEIFKNKIQEKGCLVTATSDKSTALSLLLTEVFHIAFIDCVLRSEQGTDLIQDIRKILGHSITIIMISGIIPEKSLSRYIDRGLNLFLSKPISDKELEENLDKVKNQIEDEGNTNILTTLFNKKISNIETLKLLISLNKAKDYEFFLYLNALMASKESFIIEFQFNNKIHKIICQEGVISNYENETPQLFLKKLINKNIITEQEKNQLKVYNQKECIDVLLKSCLVSSKQILDAKYDMLVDTLKEIVPGIEISLKINLIQNEKDFSYLLNQSECADLMFFFLKQKFNNHLYSLFDEEVMKRSLIFDKDFPECLKEIEPFLLNFKSGMKLKAIYNKYLNNKNSFCTYLLYILLKGGVYFSESGSNTKYNYLYERYNSLSKFIDKNKKESKKLFLINKINSKNNQVAFLINNHPDKFPIDLPKDLLDLMDKTFFKVRNLQENESTIDEKKSKMQNTIHLTEKRKVFERYMEKNQYEQASSLINSISEETINFSFDWQILYIWLHHKNTDINIKNKINTYIKSLQTYANDFKKNKLYFYILGLYHQKKQNYTMAKSMYEKTKTLDPSFQPCYEGINKCFIEILKERKKENNSFVSKLMKSFSSTTKNKRIKAG